MIMAKIEHTFGVTNENDEKTQITMTFDFAGVTDGQMAKWALSNRVIAIQRTLRTLSLEEIRALNNTSIMALDCGKKVESREERIAKYVAMGFNIEVATIAVDKPELFTEMVNNIKTDE
jgi:hypothetical protein